MKSPLYVTMVTIALLVALMLPASASTRTPFPADELAASRRVTSRWPGVGPNAMCQSGTACGG